MKRKIIAACLIACMVLIAVTSATLAYFTDKDALKNEFTVGNIDIDLWEIVDPDGKTVGKDIDEKDDHTYTNLLPTDEITKQVIVENKSKNAAYVRVTVVMNNVTPINEAIDNTYEALDYTDEQIQAVYDEVFNGWGMSYTKRMVDGHNDRRLWMKERTTDSQVLFGGQIDMYCNQDTYGMFDVKNTFKSENETDNEGFDYKCDGYYREATGVDERAYVFYLYLAGDGDEEGKDQYTLFDGLKVPAEFTEEQAAMFDGLKIDVYADAIQVEGFEDATSAFNALNKIYPVGHWNAK